MHKRKCCIPYCRTEDCEGKQFFRIDPSHIQKIGEIVPTATFSYSDTYCCQNHYDLANDTKNFIKYKHLPSQVLYLRPGILPHKRLPCNVCRVCLKLLFLEDEYVNVSGQGGTEKANIIKTCLPELDLSLTFDPVVCQNCFKSLQSYYKIKKQSLKTEVTVVKCVKEIAKKFPSKLVESCSINLFEHFEMLQNIRADVEFKEGMQIVSLDQNGEQPTTSQTSKGSNIKNDIETSTSTDITVNDLTDMTVNHDSSEILEDEVAVKNLDIVQDPTSGIYQMVYLDEPQASSSTSQDVSFGAVGQF